MNKFINISPEDSIGLDNCIYKNSLRLKKNAFTIAKINRSYACASSLLILSSEEVIKATLVLLHSNGYKVYQLKDASKFFSDHMIRHSLQMLIEMGMSLFETAEKLENRRLKRQVPKTSKKWINYTLQAISDAAFVMLDTSNAFNRIENISKFNNLKNSGLYVDYKNKILIPNSTVSQEDYNSTFNILNRLTRFYKQLRILFHPSVTKHLSINEVQEMKNNLHIFINDALEGFRFKDFK